MAILTHYSLSLRELRFPTPLCVKVWRGTATLKSGGVLLKLNEGENFTVPSFVRFNCYLDPRSNGPAVWSLSLDESAGMAIEAAAEAGKPWARKLATEIFAQPGADWRAAGIAGRWKITAARLRSSLFAEGESLRSLVREQRVASVLLKLASMSGTGCDFREAGFSSRAAMIDACKDVIDLPREIVGRAISVVSSMPLPATSGEAGATRKPHYRPYF